MAVNRRRGILKMTAAADAYVGPLTVLGMLYVNAAATTALSVTDGDANGVLFSLQATVATTNYTVSFGGGVTVAGVTLATLPAGGTLYVYFND